MANLMETAKKTGMFTHLIRAIETAGMMETFNGNGPLTLFAPTDDAFGRLVDGEFDELLGDKNKLAELLTFHIVPGIYRASDIAKEISLETAHGLCLRIDTRRPAMIISGAEVTKSDIVTDNGVIHAIDMVMSPELSFPCGN